MPTLDYSTTRQEALIAIFANRDDLPRALAILTEQGFGVGDLAVLAKGDATIPPDVAPFVERLDAGGSRLGELAASVPIAGLDELTTAAFGGYLGLLSGLLLIALPGVGVFLLAAEEAALAALTLGSSVAGFGLGALVGAILEEHTLEAHRDLYNKHVAAGDWLLVIRGSEARVRAAELVLHEFRFAHKDVISLARPA